MEVMTIVGKRSVSFTTEDNKVINGTTFYFTMVSDNVEGEMASKMFVGAERLRNLKYIPAVGEKVVVSYDRFGKVSEFRPF